MLSKTLRLLFRLALLLVLLLWSGKATSPPLHSEPRPCDSTAAAKHGTPR
ncbi:MAG: hypothetical protein KJ945_18730 [Gammaproteobacteria bacterium]|nr:hypothetical protein [Gammaproteobacteria bacterium]MBU0839328.1 hypothetical protein [Gammaproteobacteria bacterium]MBU1803631.1 hypothetical protein [Gammaproteobacteria bacterium]